MEVNGPPLRFQCPQPSIFHARAGTAESSSGGRFVPASSSASFFRKSFTAPLAPSEHHFSKSPSRKNFERRLLASFVVGMISGIFQGVKPRGMHLLVLTYSSGRSQKPRSLRGFKTTGCAKCGITLVLSS
jgi:hypothetical protein